MTRGLETLTDSFSSPKQFPGEKQTSDLGKLAKATAPS
jgi:hypothetical protein